MRSPVGADVGRSASSPCSDPRSDRTSAPPATSISWSPSSPTPHGVCSIIGRGGTGELYRARDTKLDRDVAIKVLPDLFVADAERIARFQREARTLAALNHPNIASIYGFEETNGTAALVLELVEGPTLAD